MESMPAKRLVKRYEMELSTLDSVFISLNGMARKRGVSEAN